MTEMSEPAASLVDVVEAEPWEYYEELSKAGIVWDDRMDAFLIGSYDLVRAALRQDDKALRRRKNGQALGDPRLAKLLYSPRDITRTLGEEHKRFHMWWFQAVSRANCERWRPTRIRPIVHSIIDRFADNGEAELREEFARQVPTRVIASVLGLPWQDDEWIDSCRSFMELKRGT